MKKVISVLTGLAIVPLFLTLFSSIITNNVYAEGNKHCVNLSVKESSNTEYQASIIRLCGTNLDKDGKLQEGSNFTQEYPCVKNEKSDGCSKPLKFAYFDWDPNNPNPIRIYSDDDYVGEKGQLLGEIKWNVGDTIEGDLQNAVKAALSQQTMFRPESGYEIVDGPSMSEEDYDTLTPEEFYPNADPDQLDPKVEANCYNSGGAISLGWILCPILDLMGGGVEDIYNSMIKPSLQIQPVLFTQDADSGTRRAWGIFQNFANICFVLVLLAVIFSQLTGVGIDNYGIKKILPKLIVVAVLVNLSYMICTICVDLSNIVGNGVQELFISLDAGPPAINETESPELGDKIGEALTSGTATILTFVGLLVALVGMTGAIWKNPGVALSLFVGALGVVISILFLFILLSARQAAIVVLTVISPLAFICYALPNTKSLFDKWLKIGEGLLMVYPIAGLLIGGGDFVSRLLLASGLGNGGFFSALTCMIIGIVPIFFIPTVLRSAFAALGQIGAKISGAGNQLGRYATGKIRNSERYRSTQERGLERKHRIEAGQDTSRLGRGYGNLRRRFAQSNMGRRVGADRRFSNARRAYLSDLQKNGPDQDYSNDDNFERARFRIQNKADEEAIAGIMAQNKANPEYNDPLNIVRDLRVQLRLPQDQQNSNLIQAYTRELMSRGDDGMNVLEDLVDSGVLQGHSGDRAVQNMLNTIGTSNEVKGKNRSLYNSVNNMRNHATDAAEFDNAARADNVRDLRASGDALRDRSPEELVNLGNRDFEAVANSTEDWAQNARVSMMSDSRLFSMLNGGRRTNLASGITQGFNRSIEVAGNINDDDTRNAALHQIGEQAHNIINNPNASRYFTPDDAQNVRSVIGVSGYVSPEQQAAQQQADVADQQIQQNQQIFEQIQQANAAAQGRAIYEGMREEQRNTQQQFQNYADTATPNLLGTYDAPAGFDPHDVDSHGNYRHEMYGGATTFNPITGEIVDNSDGQEMRYRPRTPHP